MVPPKMCSGPVEMPTNSSEAWRASGNVKMKSNGAQILTPGVHTERRRTLITVVGLGTASLVVDIKHVIWKTAGKGDMTC